MGAREKGSSPPKKSRRKVAQQIEFVSTDDLNPYTENARKHSVPQVREIADSIERFGFTNPILVADRTVLAGHGRLRAAIILKLKEVPVIDLSYMTPPERRAYVLADNLLAEKAEWDTDVLASELQAIKHDGIPLVATGFSEEYLSEMMGGLERATTEFGDDEPPTPESETSTEDPEDTGEAPPAESRWNPFPGQSWAIGPHRFIIGSDDDPTAMLNADIVLDKVEEAGFNPKAILAVKK